MKFRCPVVSVSLVVFSTVVASIPIANSQPVAPPVAQPTTTVPTVYGHPAPTIPPQYGYGHANRLYLKTDVGGNITRDTDLKEFFGEDVSGAEIDFDPGFRFGIGFGYNVTEWFATEIESGFMSNWIDSINGANRVDAIFSSVPLIGNIKFQGPKNQFVSPYIGGGAGVSFASIDADEIDFGATEMHGYDSDAVFAFQGFAGVRFRLNQSMGLSIEYRYFWADEANWDAEFSEGTLSDEMRFGEIETHSLSVVFDFTF